RALPRVLARVIERVNLVHEVQALRARVGELEAELAQVRSGSGGVAPRRDPLTGLLTRQALIDALQQTIERDEPVTVVIIDGAGGQEHVRGVAGDAGPAGAYRSRRRRWRWLALD